MGCKLDKASCQNCDCSCRMDMFKSMFKLQEDFMKKLVEKGVDQLPEKWPLDITAKSSQQLCRDIMLRAVEEEFECLAELKNWKYHRLTEVPQVDKAALLEEFVDSLKFQFEFLILLGFTPEEVYKAFVDKDKKIHKRLDEGV